ncbi:D-3-phosphoglycerate dehydrogenase 2, partial [Spiromyces aspiralis]
QINNILAAYNVSKQISDSKGEIAYFMADITLINHEDISRIYEAISRIPENIITRALF